MPLIQITLTGQPSAPETIHHLQRETTRLMQDILHKEAALTVVVVSQLPAAALSANGEPVANGASLQAMITAGTNTPAEKADFIFAANLLLTASTGHCAAPVYVALHELPAASWGYDGRTQAARRAEPAVSESDGVAA